MIKPLVLAVVLILCAFWLGVNFGLEFTQRAPLLSPDAVGIEE